MGAPQLVLDVLEPQQFAFERATLESKDATPLLEVLRIVRPEWYQPRMEVLAVFLWCEPAPRPVVFRRDSNLGIRWLDRSDRPEVLFTQNRR